MAASDENTYVFDTESPTELARLINQDQLITRAMGGPLAEQSSETLLTLHHILDLGCGPGGWVLDVAFAFPAVSVEGIDISHAMVNYARARAVSQGIKNATFRIMDITRPLDFSDASFDLINARFLTGVLKREAWTPFLLDCTRILRPGGVLRLTEGISTWTTSSPSLEKGNALGNEFLGLAGYGVQVEGRDDDVFHLIPHLLHQNGYQNIMRIPHELDVSIETPAWSDFYHNMEVLAYFSKPAIVHMELSTPEAFDQLMNQIFIEMHAEDFRGTWHLTTFSGTKATV
ncbi:MAG: class I SAM-dependent methyltransferase [Ktedonobacteraceae bacterium]|nr:class I SAM-dependent methyltransferase [Ktedonobacteraceae bacterium]